MNIHIFVGHKGPSFREWVGYAVGIVVAITFVVIGVCTWPKDTTYQVSLQEVSSSQSTPETVSVSYPIAIDAVENEESQIDYTTECDKIRQQIRTTYAIDVIYDETVTHLSIDGVSPLPYTDMAALYQALSTFQKTLESYPRAFFPQLTATLDLSYYFVSSIPSKNIAGVTMSDESNRLSIVYTSLFDLVHTIHHEMGHTIYYFIKKSNLFQPPFPNWEQYNQGVSSKTIGQYFVNSYALKNTKEDIASTFEYIQCGSTWDSASPLALKADYLKKEIHAALPALFG